MSKELLKKRRLSTDDWIELALTEIATVGVQGLRVNALCERSGITKGSFYSHFIDKDDLLSKVIEYWTVEQPRIIEEKLESFTGTGLEKLDYFRHLSREMKIGRRDMAFREWARFDPKAAKALEKVDLLNCRLIERYLRQADPSLSDENIAHNARLIMVAQIGARIAPWLGKDMRWEHVRDVIIS